MTKAREKADAIKRQLTERAVEKPVIHLSTGSTLLDLAMTNMAVGGLRSGTVNHFVGDSDSGKTVIAHGCLAEATINPAFAKYRLRFNRPENGALFDLKKFYGERLADRLEVFRSKTLEEFYYDLNRAIKKGDPFIEVLDSMDVLGLEAELRKFVKRANVAAKKARGEEVEEVAGSFGGAKKAQYNKERLGHVNNDIQDTGSILIIISQAAANIGFGATYNPKTYSGGFTIKHNSAEQIWTSMAGNITRDVRGATRKLGIVARVNVKKNRQTGQAHTVDIPIYTQHGMDDMRSMINWLVKEKRWEGKAERNGMVSSVTAPEFDHEGHVDKLIRKVHEGNKVGALRNIVHEVWTDIEEACKVFHVSRYAVSRGTS